MNDDYLSIVGIHYDWIDKLTVGGIIVAACVVLFYWYEMHRHIKQEQEARNLKYYQTLRARYDSIVTMRKQYEEVTGQPHIEARRLEALFLDDLEPFENGKS